MKQGTTTGLRSHGTDLAATDAIEIDLLAIWTAAYAMEEM